jgi:hypothetical protein
VLNLGGWWGILATISVLAVCWAVDISRRTVPLAKWLARDWRAARGGTETAPADTAPLTVQGQPARIETIVVAYASMEGTRLDDGVVYRALDALAPNLGAIVAATNPEIRRWGRQLSTTAFARTFFERCQPAEAKNGAAHSVLIAGTITLGEHRLHVGLVAWTKDASSVRRINVAKEKWSDVLQVSPR